ncbi:hypothetical protein [Catenuloplanes japonicus]|uniref:hypothetical protein n=1 Tax=Catenuloplanes japonicus TaxID=33876 RepID=UPI0006925163|nr:hypothetical protein [Catenuloplanes japonicus]
MHTQANRFRDPTHSHSLYALAAHPIDVVCPRCAAHAHARILADPADTRHSTSRSRRLICPACGYTADWTTATGPSLWATTVDPFFRRPLWLVDAVRGHRFWAYNREHLDLLAQFVGAELRERGSSGGCDMSLIQTLPGWMKSAANRGTVLTTITRLRTRLADPGHSAPRPGPPAPPAEIPRHGGHVFRYMA